MTSIVEKLIAAHPDKQFVFATTKREVLAALDEIRNVVEAMEDFAQFPEGTNGVVLFALLQNASTSCPDAGDFDHVHQGCQAALRTAFGVLREEIDWFPGLNRRKD
jgi:hypothetical protein